MNGRRLCSRKRMVRRRLSVDQENHSRFGQAKSNKLRFVTCSGALWAQDGRNKSNLTSECLATRLAQGVAFDRVERIAWSITCCQKWSHFQSMPAERFRAGQQILYAMTQRQSSVRGLIRPGALTIGASRRASACIFYGRLLKRREFRLRTAYRIGFMRGTMRHIARSLGSGDTLYIHNRPEYVLALPPAEKRRFKVVLHMHNDHLLNLSEQQKQRLDARHSQSSTASFLPPRADGW